MNEVLDGSESLGVETDMLILLFLGLLDSASDKSKPFKRIDEVIKTLK